MRLAVALLAVVVAVGCGGPTPSPKPSATPSAAACNPTHPNGATPPGEDPSATFHGDGGLFTSALASGGEILADPQFVNEDGSIEWKFAWWRAPGVGAAGDLRVSGHELSSGATVVADIPDGYGQRFQASGLTFPTEGCFEITAQSGDARLTFVVKVTKVAAASSAI